jgi:hypothetical protein
VRTTTARPTSIPSACQDMSVSTSSLIGFDPSNQGTPAR